MKKRTKLITAAVSLGALMTVGGTLAWFTDSETATNIVTTGYVDVKIEEHEPENNEDYGYIYEVEKGNTGIKYGNITPGVVIEKDPTVVYTGSVPGYVRYKVEVEGDATGKLTDFLQFKKDGELVDLSGLAVEDGWIYDITVRQPGDKGTLLFDAVEISNEVGNDIADQSFKIVVKADAIQAANLPGSEDGVDAEELAKVFGGNEVEGHIDDEEVVKREAPQQ